MRGSSAGLLPSQPASCMSLLLWRPVTDPLISCKYLCRQNSSLLIFCQLMLQSCLDSLLARLQFTIQSDRLQSAPVPVLQPLTLPEVRPSLEALLPRQCPDLPLLPQLSSGPKLWLLLLVSSKQVSHSRSSVSDVGSSLSPDTL